MGASPTPDLVAVLLESRGGAASPVTVLNLPSRAAQSRAEYSHTGNGCLRECRLQSMLVFNSRDRKAERYIIDNEKQDGCVQYFYYFNKK